MSDELNTPYRAALQDAVNAIAVWKNPDVKFRVRMLALLDVLVFSRLAEAASVHEVNVTQQNESGSEQETGIVESEHVHGPASAYM